MNEEKAYVCQDLLLLRSFPNNIDLFGLHLQWLVHGYVFARTISETKYNLHLWKRERTRGLRFIEFDFSKPFDSSSSSSLSCGEVDQWTVHRWSRLAHGESCAAKARKPLVSVFNTTTTVTKFFSPETPRYLLNIRSSSHIDDEIAQLLPEAYHIDRSGSNFGITAGNGNTGREWAINAEHNGFGFSGYHR